MRYLLYSLLALSLLALSLATPMVGPERASAQNNRAVSAALRTIFSPHRAPAQRTMGLSQRTFLDLVENSKHKLEVALVIDATDSMEFALNDVRTALAQMMSDLELYKQNNIAYQLVVYRDLGAPSGPVVFPLNRQKNAFTTDLESLHTAIRQLTTESGAPYFPELVDQGVHQALTQLPWSSGEDVSRWVFLFGDAPPFDPTIDEEETGASRRFATDALVALASAKQIRINCVLCTTRKEERQAYQSVLDQTRAFMNALSTGTGGLMLDLSYDDIRNVLIQAGAARKIDFSPVGTISRADVQRVRARLRKPASAVDAPVALAILPHAPLDHMTFASDSLAAQLATELRLRFKSVHGLTVAEPLVVERRFDQLRHNPNTSGLHDVALLQALGRSLGADYILWGDARDLGDGRRVKTRLYDAATGDVVAQAEHASTATIGTDQLGSLLAGDVLSASIASAAHQPLANHLASAGNNTAQRTVVTHQIAARGAHDDLVSGLADLEKAIAYPVGDTKGRALLQDARRRLERATQIDDTNALPYFLLANCLHNLAKQEQHRGGDSETLMKQFGRALRAAYRFRTTLPDGRLRREIEADYALLVRKRPGEALPLYLKLADGPLVDGGLNTDAARRANWMLAGIYGGDWGVDPQFVDQDQARERLIRILAQWPDSSEARFIKRVLRWDDQIGGTRFPHFPKENEDRAAQIDREA